MMMGNFLLYCLILLDNLNVLKFQVHVMSIKKYVRYMKPNVLVQKLLFVKISKLQLILHPVQKLKLFVKKKLQSILFVFKSVYLEFKHFKFMKVLINWILVIFIDMLEEELILYDLFKSMTNLDEF